MGEAIVSKQVNRLGSPQPNWLVDPSVSRKAVEHIGQPLVVLWTLILPSQLYSLPHRIRKQRKTDIQKQIRHRNEGFLPQISGKGQEDAGYSQSKIGGGGRAEKFSGSVPKRQSQRQPVPFIEDLTKATSNTWKKYNKSYTQRLNPFGFSERTLKGGFVRGF